jgi:hypothetical protein
MSLTSAYVVGFEVLTAVVMKTSIFWIITSCSPLRVNRRFGGTCHLLLQRESRWQAYQLCYTRLLLRWFLSWLIFRTLRWKRRVSPEHRLTFNGLHDVLSHKIELFLSHCCSPNVWEQVSHPRGPTREAYAKMNFLFSGLSSNLIYTHVWKHPINCQRFMHEWISCFLACP